MSKKDIRQYYWEFNIRIIPYNNPDGSHKELHRVLQRYDPFIAKRGTAHLGQDPIDEEKANLASSIHIFTRLNLMGGNNTCLQKSYEALIANELGSRPCGETTSFPILQKELANRMGFQHLNPHSFQTAIDSLYRRGYIEVEQQIHCALSISGREILDETKAERELRREKFVGACRLFLKKKHPSLDKHAQNEAIQQLQEGLVRAFEKRGLEMAQATFGKNTIDLSTAT
ncbi:hypothetical protein KJ865_07535, partial [Myxococcota bacterium]|nr:hypothetical protein [Myxococcota bacterium]